MEIINKKTTLNDEEKSIVQSHVSEGYEYLTKSDIGEEEMWRGVLFHHEKYDGTGYPFGLKGEEIPVLSRIRLLLKFDNAV